MRIRKPKLPISLECLSIVYFSSFSVLVAISFLVPFLMLYFRGENSIHSLALSLDKSDASLIKAQMNENLLIATKLDDLHIRNFENGVVDWDFRHPFNGTGFRFMLYNSISVNPQYLPATWGFCGWFTNSKFYFTNMTGWTAVYPAVDGVVTWNELYGFYDNANNTDSAWIKPILSSPIKEAWTSVYLTEYTSTGVDLYQTYGRYFNSSGRNFIFSIDVNLLYLNTLLENGIASRGSSGFAFIVECSTGYLIGSSVGAALYTRDADGVTLYMINATASSNTIISQASSWYLSNIGGYSQVQSAEDDISIDHRVYFVSVTPFLTNNGIKWLVFSLTEYNYYLGDIEKTRIPAILVPVLVVAISLAIGAAITCLVVTRRYIVYESVRNSEWIDEDESAPGSNLEIIVPQQQPDPQLQSVRSRDVTQTSREEN